MEEFFKKQTPSSRIKANIVAEYFPQYCKILLKNPQPEIRYLDLFAGPGLYEDDSHSTPLLIAKSCAENSSLSKKIRLMFNDNVYSEQLKSNFYKFFPEGTFTFPPSFGDKTVGESEEIHSYLTKEAGAKNPHPTLLFFDPWGYKGIDTTELSKFLEHWGNEIFLFVNIKRIHAAMENSKFDELMQSLFPTTIANIKHDRKYKASVHERLSLIMDNLATEFQNSTREKLYHCAFKFQEEDSIATSHFIIHFTKHLKGYELVKQIYYDFDNIGATLDKDGNYTFDAKKMDATQETLWEYGDQNIQALSKILENKYKGKKMTARELFDDHHGDAKFCGSHYAQTLRYMVDQGKVKATFTDNIEHKVTVLIHDNCKLEFV